MAAGKREELRDAMISEVHLAAMSHEGLSLYQSEYFTRYGRRPARALEPRHPIADQMLAEQMRAAEARNGQ